MNPGSSWLGHGSIFSNISKHIATSRDNVQQSVLLVGKQSLRKLKQLALTWKSRAAASVISSCKSQHAISLDASFELLQNGQRTSGRLLEVACEDRRRTTKSRPAAVSNVGEYLRYLLSALRPQKATRASNACRQARQRKITVTRARRHLITRPRRAHELA
jgi:hypothetical protein